MRTLLISGLLIFLVSSTSSASAQNIQGGMIFGINGSQVDRDNMAGYNKIGLNAGAKAIIPFSEQWSGSLEMVFSQKGSKFKERKEGPTPIGQQNRQSFNYIDVPVVVNYRIPEGEYSESGVLSQNYTEKILLGAGISIGYLINYRRMVSGSWEQWYSAPGARQIYSIRTIQPTVIANLGYRFTEHWVGNARLIYSAINIGNGQLHNVIALRAYYLF